MKQIKELLSKQMTRKEFLQLFGMALLSIFGVSNFISYIARQDKSNQPSQIGKIPTSHGFGSRTFGN